MNQYEPQSIKKHSHSTILIAICIKFLLASIFLMPLQGVASDFYWELHDIKLDEFFKKPDRKGIVEYTETSFVVQDHKQRLNFSWTIPDRKILRPGETVTLTMYCDYERFDPSARITTNNWIEVKAFVFQRSAGFELPYVGWVDPTIPSIQMNRHQNLRFIKSQKVKAIAPQNPTEHLYLEVSLLLNDINIYGGTPRSLSEN
jgi:hypothetical protein